MRRHGTTMAAAALSAIAMCGSGVARQVGEGQQRARDRDDESRKRDVPTNPPENLPGETNRQYAARVKALRSTHPTGADQ